MSGMVNEDLVACDLASGTDCAIVDNKWLISAAGVRCSVRPLNTHSTTGPTESRMSFRGLQKPREMWAALHDQGQADQRLWEMALQNLRGHGCPACRRYSELSENTLSVGPGQTTTYVFERESA